MAKRSRSSLTRAASMSSSSAESCINVISTRKTRSISNSPAASPASTPPTSVPDGSVSDAASVKQTAMSTNTTEDAITKAPTRRDSRRKSGSATYKLATVSGKQRAFSSTTTLGKESRDFSGATLVADAPTSSTNTPQRKLLDDGVKALDLDWEIDDVPAESAASSEPAVKSRRRNSTHVDRLVKKAVGAVDRVKSVLGKRSRTSEDDGKDDGRRQSRRLVVLEQEKTEGLKQSTEIKTEEVTERPSKMARLSSMLSLTSSASIPSMLKPTVRTRPVKKYQRQGLFAGQPSDFDQGSSNSRSKSRKSKTGPSTSTASVSAKSDLMPLPMFGYAEKDKSFVVPFDVFAPAYRARGEEKPKDWGRIYKNRLVGDAKAIWRNTRLERSVCICEPPTPGSTEPGCSDCLNRHMHYECDDDNCNLGEQCSNRDFANLAARMERAHKSDRKSFAYIYHAGVEVIRTGDRGFGVRAVRSFSPGEIITEYIGEIITPEEAERRIREEYKDKGDYYQMEFDQGMILDATKGSIARFVNHSCEPNSRMEKRFVAGQPRMALFAGDSGVLTGEELTYDYNFDNYNAFNVQQCRCGAASCRGVLGPRPKDSKKPATTMEKDDAAANLKRKAPEVLDSPSDADYLRSLLTKKRKAPQFASKGWAYTDPDMEAARQAEAEIDREIARLKREGVVATVTTEIPKASLHKRNSKSKAKNMAMKIEEKVMSKMTKSKETKHTQMDEPKESKKPSVLNRISGSLKRKVEESQAESQNKRRSVNSALRQSTLSFHRLSDPDMTEEQAILLERPATANGLKRTVSSAKNSLMGRKASKRASTVRLVEASD